MKFLWKIVQRKKWDYIRSEDIGRINGRLEIKWCADVTKFSDDRMVKRVMKVWRRKRRRRQKDNG